MFGKQYTLTELCDKIQADIKKVSGPVMKEKYAIDIYLRSLYYILFINNGEGAGSRLDPVLINDIEDLHELGWTGNLIRMFRVDNLREKYGLSLKEWFDMPMNLADIIQGDTRRENSKAADEIAALEDEINKKTNG